MSCFTRPLDACLQNVCATKQSRHSGALVIFVLALSILPAMAQNKINTIAGGGTVSPSALSADTPGPTAVVEDPNGNIYVAPPAAQYIFQWNKTSGAVTVFAGTGYITYHKITQKATLSPLWSPSGLAADRQGNIYIADTGNNAIRKVDTSGTLTTVAGTSKPCPGGACGDNGPAVKAKLNAPQGVAIDSKGNIFIADSGDNRVRCVIVSAGGCGSGSNGTIGTILNYAGNANSACGSSTDPCGDGGKARLAFLNTPMGIALDKSGNLYIADTLDQRIRKVTKVGYQYIINSMAGTGVLCSSATSACGDGGPATSAELGGPRAVSVDGTGNVYIADTRDHRVRIVTGTTINAFAGTGQFGFTGDGGAPLKAELSNPNGVYVDVAGNVFISDTGNQRIRKVAAGVINTFMGGGNGGDGQSAVGTYAMLADPYQVAVDSSNNFYIADTENNRIRAVNTQSSAITVAGVLIQPGDIATVAGTGDIGYAGDNGPALSATLNSPKGLAVDSAGNIYIADSYNGVVREVDTAGIITTLAPTNAVTLPSSLAVDKSGNLFIADPLGQVIWELSGGTISVVAGTGTAGYSGNGGLATSAQLDVPFGVAVDANDNLYIADAGNNVIRCVIGTLGGCWDTAKTYPVGTILPYAYDGNFNFRNDGGPVLKASRWFPNEVALDSQGNVFIGGGNNPLVQRVDAAAGTILTVAGNASQWWYYGFQGDGSPAVKAHLDNIGLTVDGNETLLIADGGNNRIRSIPNMIGVTTLTPNFLNFGKQPVGTKSAPLQVTLQNTGANDVAISAINVSGDFSQTNTCPVTTGTVPPSNMAFPATCGFTVYFTPTQKGTRNGSISITDNAYHSPQVIKLTGVGD